MSGGLWRIQRVMRKILGRPALRICAESELGLSLKSSGAWGLHRLGLIVVADAVVDEPVLLNSVIAHEAAHALLSPASPSPEASDLDGLRSLLGSPWQTWPLHRGAPWSGHDSRWIRASCHVVHRMKAWGLVTVPAAVADLRLYGLQGSLSDYSESLCDEPAALDWLPLGEALARPAPAEFEELWAADVRRSVVMGSSAERKSDELERSGTSAKSGAGSKRRRK